MASPCTNSARRKPGAARNRRHREFVAAGMRIARAPYDADVLNLLVQVMRTLAPDRAGDPAAIGKAMYKALKESATAAKSQGMIP